jgi:hypothetical protein
MTPTSLVNDLVGVCFICKRRHDNLGVSASERHPVKWACKPCLNSTNLKKVYHMRLDAYEQQALEDGGNAGGAFLDEIGKTDLASLDEHEWSRFLGIVLQGYADSMREIVRTEVPY